MSNLNIQKILISAGQKYELLKRAKEIKVAPEINSDTVKAALQALVEELNIEINRLDNKIDDLKFELRHADRRTKLKYN